jgi:malonyl-CoA decarboxylase
MALDRKTGSTGLLDRTLGNLRGAWHDIALRAKSLIGTAESVAPALPAPGLDVVRELMRECLLARGGEVSARARAAELGRLYLGLDAAGRIRFLKLLAEEFDIDHDRVERAAVALVSAKDDKAREGAERELRASLVAPRVRLLTQFNALPEGVKFLVDLRAELLGLIRRESSLAGLEADLKALLTQWFDVGFLELTRITWDSPAALLEKIVAYEAVHAIRSWNDLKNRLDSDRRCFAFVHPRMPNEPLIFVEVALVRGIAADVQAILDETAPLGDPRAADTAIFYSISNAQKGLAGISFGGFLIKRVVDQLSAEYPQLQTFATLSPMPGFRAWLDRRFTSDDPPVLTRVEERIVAAALGRKNLDKGTLEQLLADDDWMRNPALAAALAEPVKRFAAAYLLTARRDDRKALDPVANFHLGNGARVEKLNVLADRSHKGIEQSFGTMVNYLYRLADIETNHEAYEADGRIRAARHISALLE